MRKLWPENEMPCLWMQAGLIDFKLCDRNYDCENCPFDAVMRNKGRDGEEGGRGARKTALYYGYKFSVIKMIDRQTAQIGINQNAFVLLPASVDLILPEAGTMLKKDDRACTLVTEQGKLDLFSPLSGEVILTNPTALERINQAWFQEVWLYRQRVKNLEQGLRNMFMGEQARAFLSQQYAHIFRYLKAEIQGRSGSSMPTQMDGGVPVVPMERIFRPQHYFTLIQRLFLPEKS